MSAFSPATRLRLGHRIFIFLLPLALLFGSETQNLAAGQDAAALPQAPPIRQQTPEQLQQLVAPIALYPDSLVAQVLAASTFPAQVVEADRWVQAHPDLKGQDLAQAVDQQAWDPSVKALTAFPAVLANMDKNISWTSSLGDAYYNQEQEVMDAVQIMRQKAQQAGTLQTTQQQVVTTRDSNIVIEPASPEFVYVPAYDPWVVYGYPIAPWPYWYPYPGIWYEGPGLWFGVGFGIGFYGGYGWGWGHWGSDWHHHHVTHDHDRYVSGSRTFYNRDRYYQGGGERGVDSRVRGGANAGRGEVFNRPGEAARPFAGDNRAARGYAEPRGQKGTRSGAFSDFNHGGETRSFSSRGSASFGRGGGGFHGGGGGRRR
jgi:uncharacterized membrane protein YgcG